MNPLAAIFDLDGLLVDSEPVWHEVEIEVLGRHGVPLTVERCLETKGKFVGEAVAHWYARYPWDGPSQEEVAHEIVEVMATRMAAVALKPGVHHALDFCEARHARLAVASSSPYRLIDAALRGTGLATRFAVVHSAEHETAGKPDPSIFLTTARLLDVDGSRCVVFEDSPAGVVAAKAAGMACVAVPEAHPLPGADPFAGSALGADVVLGSLADLDDGTWAACAQSLDGAARGAGQPAPG